ncbi:ankyrin repeat-containing domain [Trichoderma arundinaceum]|uniref:Ankyrin repeat-containing domain n=1 Tax=Trichoderma arundinaceum TaxID=490622 RepID=A0A395NHQ7_TRIAR|nr:ankyrin repeat-containing domain [Trichoderma arundinaceum]
MSDSGSDSGSDSSSDSSAHWPPKCHAYIKPCDLRTESEEDNVKKLIEQGNTISPSILWAAVYWCRPESVDLLLSAGVDPNWRHAKAEEIMPRGGHDWLDRDPDRNTRWEDIGTNYPLHVAAFEGGQQSYNIVRSLLRHGADPYAVFAAELEDMQYVEEARPLFPGQEICHPQDPNTESDWQTQRMLSLPGEDFSGTIPPFERLEFGLQSVIHSILEDGSWFELFLDCPEFMNDLKLEHRDPQGRTLFLSACRRRFGADKQLRTGWKDDAEFKKGQDHDSDTLAALPPGIDSRPCAEEAQIQTAIQLLLNLGADPLVTDNQGKNALHQLLDTHAGDFSSPPKMRQSLRHLAARFPSLVNQPDRNGMSPIHTATRRLWRYTELLYTSIHRDEDIEKRPPEDCVLDLIEAGADVHARDARNNTVLHYLADAHLDALDYGERRRQLFSLLLDKFDCALDINTPNTFGLRPIQIMLGYSTRKDDWQEHDLEFSRHMPSDTTSVDVELFRKFDEAGTDWKVRDGRGRTLLHGVAQTSGCRARIEWRCRYLVEKGVDPLARDDDGKTSHDLVAQWPGYWVIDLLKEYEEAEAHKNPSDIVNSEHQT